MLAIIVDRGAADREHARPYQPVASTSGGLKPTLRNCTQSCDHEHFGAAIQPHSSRPGEILVGASLLAIRVDQGQLIASKLAPTFRARTCVVGQSPPYRIARLAGACPVSWIVRYVTNDRQDKPTLPPTCCCLLPVGWASAHQFALNGGLKPTLRKTPRNGTSR